MNLKQKFGWLKDDPDLTVIVAVAVLLGGSIGIYALCNIPFIFKAFN